MLILAYFLHMKKNFLNEYKRFYFAGICGISMSALAKHCYFLEKTVGGSDINEGETYSSLTGLGIKVYKGNSVENVKKFRPDIFIYTSALDNGEELVYAQKNGIKTLKRSQLLGYILSLYQNSVAICGAHGKTTATAMITRVTTECGLSPTAFIGGTDVCFSNYFCGNGNLCIAEACEYKKNFLDIKPKYSVVLNIDNDHMDSYADISDMKSAFELFRENTFSVVNADDINCKNLSRKATVTFGMNKKADYRAEKIEETDGCYSFECFFREKRLGKIQLNVLGFHNIYNALATVALCDALGVEFPFIQNGLRKFTSVKRRMEKLGFYNNVKVFADYAHHPTEIKAVINTLGKSNKILYIFQPHTFSRTKKLFNSFKKVFGDINNLIIYKTYPARELYDKDGDAETLFNGLKTEKIKKLFYADNPLTLKKILDEQIVFVNELVVLGAGDIYDIIKSFV